jgi:hypothetical protein
MRVVGRRIADVCNFFVNVSFYASAQRRVKLGKVAKFQVCTVAVALWATQCRDTEKDQRALRTAKRLRKRRSNIGFYLAQVFFRIDRCGAARAGCCHGLLVNAISDVARHKHTWVPALD